MHAKNTKWPGRGTCCEVGSWSQAETPSSSDGITRPNTCTKLIPLNCSRSSNANKQSDFYNNNKKLIFIRMRPSGTRHARWSTGCSLAVGGETPGPHHRHVSGKSWPDPDGVIIFCRRRAFRDSTDGISSWPGYLCGCWLSLRACMVILIAIGWGRQSRSWPVAGSILDLSVNPSLPVLYCYN